MTNPMIALFIAGAIFAGSLIPVQTGFNTQLARALQSTTNSTIVVFIVGLVTLLTYALLSRTPLPTMAQISSVPPLAWGGGLLGMTYIVMLIALAPKLGAAPTVACVVLGQILCSMVIDHFGLLGFEIHEISWGRMAGLGLLVSGVALIRLS